MSTRVVSIAPFEYIHVLNKNDNTKRLVVGPRNFALEDHEEIVSKVCEKMVIIPNLHYVEIKDPIEKDSEGNIVKDRFGLPKYKWSIIEVRTRDKYSQPFALYPEEKLNKSATALEYIDENEALHLRAIINCKIGEESHAAGEEWYFSGPDHYIPRQDVENIKKVNQIIIYKTQALKLRANRTTKDKDGNDRRAGEEWLIRQEGAYLPNVGEEVVGLINANVLDDKTAIHLRATFDFTDYYGIKRKAGEEWLITSTITNSHIPDVYEKVVEVQSLIVLTADEYCVIINPYDEKERTNELGKIKLIKGVASFFLNPGEELSGGAVQKVKILTEGESLLLQAKETHEDDNGKTYKAGTKWMIHGPCRFIPPVEVNILETRKIIPLDKNEGIYIRNIKDGKIYKHMGSSYSLKPEEILWEKKLSETVEKIYLRDSNISSRDKTRIVAYKCPFNSIMQIYNLKKKTNRIVFGPDLAVLDPDEEFTLMSLSGNCPKVQDVVQTLYLKLGPVFSTDEFDVETVDHTRLKLRISYNWRFDIKSGQEAEALKIFSIRDFIGDMCLTLASRIRSYIATLIFEDFHKNSDRLIKRAVFGENENGEINTKLRYDECHLIIDDVDIQSVSPTDPTTQMLLQKSVSLTIELATKTIEQEYTIQALIKDQEFKGELEKLKIANEIEYLKKLADLSKLKVESTIIEKTGLSKAQSLAEKEAVKIESKSKVKLAEMTKLAAEIENDFDLKQITKRNEIEYLDTSESQRLDLKKTLEENLLEANKFKNIIESLGQETLVEVARAGPELQAKLLSGLNLSGYILTDGNNPINLFNVADNLVKK